ncbi:MAG: phosphoenolpyruvate synthase [Candidatus Aenigmatarchaeota archaeon]
MHWTVTLEALGKENVGLVGGKAANLAEMINANLPVPPGFAVTTESFLKFIDYNRLKPKIDEIMQHTDIDDQNRLVESSKKIKAMIIAAKIPPQIEEDIRSSYQGLYISEEARLAGGKALDFIMAGRDQTVVAVRSSATSEDAAEASFAGQMVSILNVRGAKRLVESVKICWSSLYEPRAIFYRRQNKITDQAIAVIVQKMIASEKSGVMFTVNPVDGDTGKIVIEAAWGLGESIVSGTVIPDTYVCDKRTGAVEIKISKKDTMRVRDVLTGDTKTQPVLPELVNARVLGEDEIGKLVELAKRVEDHYKFPQDIEFCLERNKVYLVQTRPVTTLKNRKGESLNVTDGAVVKGLPASPGVAKGSVKIVYGLMDLEKFQQGEVLVTKMTNPDYVPIMKKAAAIITDQGGLTAHAAIVSRELGVPCIVGTGNATAVLKTGDFITVDATSGLVYMGDATEKVRKPANAVSIPAAEYGLSPSDLATGTKIKVNVAFPEIVEKKADALRFSDGVGLLRAEHMLMDSGKHPMHLAKENPEELVETLINGMERIAKVFGAKPVWYRSLDARTDEFKNLEGGGAEPHESNPMLGWHGIRRSLDEKEILECELNAIKNLHERGFRNVHLMLPFVSFAEEFTSVKALAKELNVPPSVKIGIMVETPASAIMIEDFCEAGIEFVSFGSNDLTQLVLGVDRNNENIAKLYRENNKANLELMRQVIKKCKEHDIETSICGEAPSRDDDFVEKLVAMGIDSISVEVDALQHVRQVVARKEKKITLESNQ